MPCIAFTGTRVAHNITQEQYTCNSSITVILVVIMFFYIENYSMRLPAIKSAQRHAQGGQTLSICVCLGRPFTTARCSCLETTTPPRVNQCSPPLAVPWPAAVLRAPRQVEVWQAVVLRATALMAAVHAIMRPG